MKKRLISILLFLFIVSSAYAQIGIQKSDSVAKISPLGEAEFDIEIINPSPKPDTFKLQLSDVLWNLRADPLPHSTTGVDINGFDSEMTKVFLKPKKGVKEGIHYVELLIKSTERNTTYSELFVVQVDPSVVDYDVNVPGEILEPTSIDPRKTNSVKVLIKSP